MCGDVRMVQRGEDFRFPLEAGEAFGIVGKEIRQDLEGDFTVQCGIAGPIDLAHATGPKGGEDLVRCRGGCQGRGPKRLLRIIRASPTGAGSVLSKGAVFRSAGSRTAIHGLTLLSDHLNASEPFANLVPTGAGLVHQLFARLYANLRRSPDD